MQGPSTLRSWPAPIMRDARERLIVALDVSSLAEAHRIVDLLGQSVQTFKVGQQLFTAEGPQAVRDLVRSGRKVFLDLKYHDIPNTVGAAVREAALKVLAVTVLTSLTDNDLEKMGVRGRVEDQVLRLAAMAIANGCQGIVASAHEASALRNELGQEFIIVTPGVRPPGTGHGDQARVVTPEEAIASGATHIVVGRPITEAADPAAEAKAILAQITT
jgi:orotidine-5'-phosphate decarboxylase